MPATGASVAETERAVSPVGPEPVLRELIVDRDVVLGLQLEGTVSSDTARIEDPVVARVTREVRVGDDVAIPAGSRAYGEVVAVERGGRIRERARLVVRFSSLSLPSGTRLPISTDSVLREGSAPSTASAAKIGGGAIGGAIIGGLLGGGKGAVVGGAAGAGAGTAATMAGARSAVVLGPGMPITVRLQAPVTVPLDR